MRRDSKDQRWKDTKEAVYLRDSSRCRLMKVLTISEALMLRKNAGPFLNHIDCAHFLSVGQNPEDCYDSDDIVCLNHYSHSNLDDFKSPIDGHHIPKDEVYKWWIRILKGNTEQYKALVDKGLLEENND